MSANLQPARVSSSMQNSYAPLKKALDDLEEVLAVQDVQNDQLEEVFREGPWRLLAVGFCPSAQSAVGYAVWRLELCGLCGINRSGLWTADSILLEMGRIRDAWRKPIENPELETLTARKISGELSSFWKSRGAVQAEKMQKRMKLDEAMLAVRQAVEKAVHLGASMQQICDIASECTVQEVHSEQMLANLQPDQVPSAMKSSILFSDPSLPLAVRSFFRAVRRFGCSALVLPADAARAVALLDAPSSSARRQLAADLLLARPPSISLLPGANVRVGWPRHWFVASICPGAADGEPGSAKYAACALAATAAASRIVAESPSLAPFAIGISLACSRSLGCMVEAVRAAKRLQRFASDSADSSESLLKCKRFAAPPAGG